MAEPDDLLTVAEAAHITKIYPDWVHARIARGEIPAVVVDGKRHLRRADQDAWIETRRVVPRPTGRRN